MTNVNVIAIEGCDATGKTTLAKQLSDKLNMLIVKGSSFENAECDNTQLFKHFNKVANASNVIIDRTIYSNRVYATLYDDYAILTDEQRMQIEDKFKNKTLVLYLTADVDTIIDRINVRGDDYVTPDKIQSIVSNYNSVMSDAMNNDVIVLTYNTTEWTTNGIVDDVQRYMEYGV